ncbi:MAG: RNA polymerase sigma factor [Polyangiales bacterium]
MVATLTAVRAPDDLVLAARCADGDRAAQRELLDRERRRVHATLYRLLGSNSHIEDLLQEAFLGIFRSIKHFRGEASLSTWIDRCTVRVAYAHFGRRPPRTAQLELLPEMSSGDPSAEHRTLMREAARHLYAELDRMDAKLRIAFTLHAVDGRPLEVVAQMMEASLVATKTRVWRARRALEKHARNNPVLRDFLSTDGATKVAHKDAGR